MLKTTKIICAAALTLNFLLLTVGLTSNCMAQSTTFGDSLSIQVEASVSVSPPSITLSWLPDVDVASFSVYRKSKTATNWGSVLATIPGNGTQYVDNAAVPNTWYDYRIVMNPTQPNVLVAYGYVSSAIELEANSNRGVAIVVIENSFVGNTVFDTKIAEMLLDLELDGWFPKTLFVNNTDAVATVKSSIVSLYNQDPTKTNLLFLVGDVPAPHSGDQNIDGHPDHKGAWATDMFYGEVNGFWQDNTVNNTTSANIRNHNIPGDGKPDNNFLPSDMELQVGRVDLSELPAFSETEEQLLVKYLTKLHQFKTNQLNVQHRAIIDANFNLAEGFSQNAYRNLAPLVGRNNLVVGDFFTNLSYNTSTTGTYLWGYGDGAGSYTSIGGVGNTTTFTGDSLSNIFTMTFGSYFGDWDFVNSVLRAPLAQGNTLTNCWTGRPNWHLFPMGLGENIGFVAKMTQNNSNTYLPSTLSPSGGGISRLIVLNLMGDPSLRMKYIDAPTNLTVTQNGNDVDLVWIASPTALGYNIYRRDSATVDFIKLNTAIITATNFTDNTLTGSGKRYYYVKAVELEVSPSGSYHNESLALKDSIDVSITVGIDDLANREDLIQVYPNPTNAYVTIKMNESVTSANVLIVNLLGEIVIEQQNISNNAIIDLSVLSNGIYTVIIKGEQVIETKKIQVIR